MLEYTSILSVDVDPALGQAKIMSGARRRIVIAPSAYYPHIGGIEEVSRLLALGLMGRGWEVAIVTNRFPSTALPVEEMDGVSVRRFEFQMPSRSPEIFGQVVLGAYALAQYIEFLKDFRPAVAQIMGLGPPCVYTMAAKLMVPLKFVATTHGELLGDPQDVFRRSAFARWTAQLVLGRADQVLGCSQSVLSEAQQLFRFPDDIRVIYNGVDSHRGQEEPFDFPQSERVILSAARLVENKDIDIVIRAFAALKPDPQTRLIIAGDGSERGRLEQLTRELGLTERVYFAGFLTQGQLEFLFSKVAMFISPATIEGFPMTSLAAMRAGRTVIAANAGGHPELVEHEVNGLLFAPKSTEELSAAIQRLLTDISFRRKLESGALKTASFFSTDRMIDAYEELYAELLAGVKTPGQA